MDAVLKQIISELRHNDAVEVAWIYGSRADKTNRVDSDYDLAVAFADFLSDPTDRRLRPEVLALELKAVTGLPDNMISVVDVNLASLSLGYSIASNCIVLKGENTSRCMTEEIRMLALWEESYG